VVREIGGQLAVHVRPVDAGLLEHHAALEHARDAPAAARPLPGVSAEVLAAIGIRELAADLGLQLVKVPGGAVEQVGHPGMLASSRAHPARRDERHLHANGASGHRRAAV
jgi:hypothetical protein